MFIFFIEFPMFHVCKKKGGGVAQSAERATPGEEVPNSIPAVAARSLLVGSTPSGVWPHVKLSDALSWGPSGI